jgi:hypothetical protein
MKKERCEASRNYVCLNRSEGNKLYEYYNFALAEQEAQTFEEHLLLCFLCQEEILTLDTIFNALKENKELFG